MTTRSTRSPGPSARMRWPAFATTPTGASWLRSPPDRSQSPPVASRAGGRSRMRSPARPDVLEDHGQRQSELVQCGHRFAAIGMRVAQNGHSLSAGFAGVGEGLAAAAFIALTTKKRAAATIRKLITVLRKMP